MDAIPHILPLFALLLTASLLSLPSVIDYCSFGNHSCDHECVSVLNGYRCRCNEGYRLLDNGKACHGELHETKRSHVIMTQLLAAGAEDQAFFQLCSNVS